LRTAANVFLHYTELRKSDQQLRVGDLEAASALCYLYKNKKPKKLARHSAICSCEYPQVRAWLTQRRFNDAIARNETTTRKFSST
jgi:hypothetical protein